MAELSYKITGDNSALVNATNAAIANIENLTSAVNDANVSLQFKNGVSALDTLGQKLLVVQGNASLFGDSIKLQAQEIGAYQTAINSLLSNGFEPMDGDVQRLKSRLDELTTSLQAVNNVQPKSTVFEPGSSVSAENLPNGNTGAVTQESALVAALNQQLEQGVITLQQYNEALLSANSTTNTLSQTTQQLSEQVEVADGYINGLKQYLTELNQTRLTTPAEDLVYLNSEIQQTEIALQQASNIGKVGFDEFGNSVRGVSLQNVNGQLIALSNNLFGARQIARDLARAFTSDSLAGTVKNVTLLAVDFLFYAQNAAFATGVTTAVTAAIGTEGTVATGAAFSIEALGVAFTSLLTPLNLIVLGVAVAAGGFEAYEKSQKTATQAATEHLKVLRDQKQALEDVITTLSAQQQVEAKASDTYSDQTAKLGELYLALQQQITIGNDYTKQLTDLQNAFPQFFANIDTATAKTDALSEAYKNAGDAIKALGIVTAATQLSSNANVDLVKNQVGADSLIPQLQQARTELAALQQQAEKTTDARKMLSEQSGVSSLDPDVLQQQAKVNALLDQIQKYNTAVALAKGQVAAFNQIAAQNQSAADAGKNSGLINGLQQQLKNLQDIEPYLKTQQQVEQNVSQQKTIQAQIDTLEGKNLQARLTAENESLSINQQIANILNQSFGDVNKSGLSGYAKSVADVNAQYETLYARLQAVNTKIAEGAALFATTNGKKGLSPTQVNTATSEVNSASNVLQTNQSQQLANAKIAEAQRVSDTITQINNEFGIKSEQSREKEIDNINEIATKEIAIQSDKSETLEEINTRYQLAIKNANGDQQKITDAENVKNAEIQQAQDSANIVVAIKNGQLIAINAINDKYFQQEVDLYNKINAVNQEATDEESSNQDNETARINKTFADRLATVNSYFEKVRAASQTGNSAVDAFNNLIINAQQSAVIANLTAAQKQQIQLSISKPLIQGIDQAASSFYTTLTQINQQTDQSFKAIFADLTKQLNTSMNSIFLNVVEKGLETALQNAIKSGTSSLFNTNGTLTGTGAAIAGAGLAGGLISGITPTTSVAGQGAGGALSGAAAGAAIGSVIPGLGTAAGAVIGGAIGLIGGIFSAQKAQKALQEQQLEQAQEQTALLKASLAYTSQIIGRDTVSGVVTNVTVGATGQLVATVSGNTLQFILNRVTNVR